MLTRNSILLSWLKNITVEPTVFLYAFVFGIGQVLHTNLLLQKSCRLNCTTEPDPKTPCDDTEKGVQFVAFVNSDILIFKLIILALIILTCAPYSDIIGKRKPFILLPCYGLIISNVFGAVHSYWWSLSPIYAVLTETVCCIIFGNILTVLIFSEMYLANETTNKNRTIRFGVLSLSKLLGMAFGQGFAGYTINWIGFLGAHLFCAFLGLVTLITTMICIRNDLPRVDENSKPICRRITTDIIRGVGKSWIIVFGKGDKRHKLAVALLLLSKSILYISHEGEYSVMYIYLRYRFDWDEKMYSIFAMSGTFSVIIGLLFSSFVLDKILKLHDCIIGLIAGFWDSMITVAFLFSTQNWQLYTATSLDLFFGVAGTVYSSYLSKFYESNEQGKLHSVSMTCSLLIPICFPMYNLLFRATLKTFPHAFFIISIVLYAMTGLFSCVVYFLTKDRFKKQ